MTRFEGPAGACQHHKFRINSLRLLHTKPAAKMISGQSHVKESVALFLKLSVRTPTQHNRKRKHKVNLFACCVKHHRLAHKNLNPFCLALQAKRSATYFTVQNTFVLCCHFVLAEKEQTVKPLAKGIIKIASSSLFFYDRKSSWRNTNTRKSTVTTAETESIYLCV